MSPGPPQHRCPGSDGAVFGDVPARAKFADLFDKFDLLASFTKTTNHSCCCTCAGALRREHREPSRLCVSSLRPPRRGRPRSFSLIESTERFTDAMFFVENQLDRLYGSMRATHRQQRCCSCAVSRRQQTSTPKPSGWTTRSTRLYVSDLIAGCCVN